MSNSSAGSSAAHPTASEALSFGGSSDAGLTTPRSNSTSLTGTLSTGAGCVLRDAPMTRWDVVRTSGRKRFAQRWRPSYRTVTSRTGAARTRRAPRSGTRAYREHAKAAAERERDALRSVADTPKLCWRGQDTALRIWLARCGSRTSHSLPSARCKGLTSNIRPTKPTA